MTNSCDVIVIGGGIAGASAGAELSRDLKTVIVEREDQPGYHSTGRSAATFVPSYGPPAIMALTRAGGAFFRNPPDGFCDTALLAPRGEMMIAGPGDEQHVADARKLGLRDLPFEEARRRVPPLRTDGLIATLIDEAAQDIDVDLLHRGFLRQARRKGADVVTSAEVVMIERQGGNWRVETTAGHWQAPVVVNAAGAWADVIAGLAGARPQGITPKRRSAALIPVPEDWDVMSWPLVLGAGETFYFKPMGGKLMVSPADATPVEPHDAWADDMLIAEAIEKFQNTTGFEVTRLDSTWGGLRCFAPDGNPVVGFDPEADGFFWLAGQGGYGIQTSPALSRVTAALVAGAEIPEEIAAFGVDRVSLSPARRHG